MSAPIRRLSQERRTTSTKPHTVRVRSESSRNIKNDHALRRKTSKIGKVTFRTRRSSVHLSLMFFNNTYLCTRRVLPLRIQLRIRPLSTSDFRILSTNGTNRILTYRYRGTNSTSSCATHSSSRVVRNRGDCGRGRTQDIWTHT